MPPKARDATLAIGMTATTGLNLGRWRYKDALLSVVLTVHLDKLQEPLLRALATQSGCTKYAGGALEIAVKEVKEE